MHPGVVGIPNDSVKIQMNGQYAQFSIELQTAGNTGHGSLVQRIGHQGQVASSQLTYSSIVKSESSVNAALLHAPLWSSQKCVAGAIWQLTSAKRLTALE